MRAAIFIDGAYFLRRAQEAGTACAWERLAEHLLAPLTRDVPIDLLRCYFYDCPPWTSGQPTAEEKRRLETHERFAAELDALPRWQVRLGKLERRREGEREVFAQKRVDVQLSVDLVRHCAAGHIQYAILVAGDSDFVPAVNAAKESGATVILWCGDDTTVHKDLITQADETHRFDWRALPAKTAPARRPRTASPRGAGTKTAAPRGGRGAPAAQAAASSPATVPPAPVDDGGRSPLSDGGDADGAAGDKSGGTRRRRRRGGRGGRKKAPPTA